MAAIPVSSSSSDNGQTLLVLSKRSPSSPVFFAFPTHTSPGYTGFRYFPCSGYLGLTPIRAEGIVRTRLDDDQKLLQAKSITISIRCYECRTRVTANYTNVLVDHTLVLWSKPEGVEYEPIGNLEFPFQISIPANVAGFSNASFVDYRCIWRLEAVLSHSPVAGVGSRQVRHSDLSLVRYDIPSWLPPPSNPEPMLNLQTTKPRAPRIRYSIHSPQTAIGPMDLVSIPLHLQPLDKDVSIRSASVVVERRIVLNDNPTPPNLSLWTRPDGLYTNSSDLSLHKPLSSPHLSPVSPNMSTSSTSLLSLPSDPEPTASLHSSCSTITPNVSSPSTSSATPFLHSQPTPISPGQQSSTKSIVNSIADAQSSGSFTRDQNGVLSKTLTLQWPSAKSRGHWAIGETITSDLVSVKFFLRTKIVVASSSGTDTIELADKELYVVSTNEAERQLAGAKYGEQLEALSVGSATIRSKSKSPRRSKANDLPSPSESSTSTGAPKSNRNTNGKSRSQVDSSASAPARGGKGNRRPHTSAGPLDRPVNFAGTAYGRDQTRVSGATRPEGNANAGASGTRSAQPKRHSETIMRNVLNQPDYLEGFAPMNKNAATKRAGASGTDNISTKTSSSKCSVLVSPSSMDIRSLFRNTSTTPSSCSASSSGHSVGSDSVSQSSGDLREWEAELARIEARSKESSVLFALTKKRKKLMDYLCSSVGVVPSSEDNLPVQHV